MKKFISTYWEHILFFTVIGLVGGFATGLYSYDSLSADLLGQLTAQGITRPILAMITAIQSAGYGLFLGSIGIVLSKKIGLWKEDIKP